MKKKNMNETYHRLSSLAVRDPCQNLPVRTPPPGIRPMRLTSVEHGFPDLSILK